MLAIPLDRLRINKDTDIRLEPDVLGRFFPFGPHQITLIHGPQKAPLTLLSHYLAVAVARSGYSVAYLDSGRKYSPRLIRSLSGADKSDGVLNHIYVAELLNLKDIQRMPSALEQIDNLFLIIIDSLTTLLNLSGDPGSKSRQRLLFQVLEILRSFVNSANVHAVMCGYSRRDWKSGDIRPIGGNVLVHELDWSILVETLENTADHVRLLVEKSTLQNIPRAVVLHMTRNGIRRV